MPRRWIEDIPELMLVLHEMIYVSLLVLNTLTVFALAGRGDGGGGSVLMLLRMLLRVLLLF